MVKRLESHEAIKAKVDELLQKALAEQRFDEVARLAKIAEEIKMLDEQDRKTSERRRDLAATVYGSTSEATAALDELGPGEESARERGRRVRKHYIESILGGQGVHLDRIASKKYRTQGKRMVGISYARELDIRSDSWFLGLSDEHYDFLILLCESSKEEIAAFILPTEVVRRIWNALSRSNGQVKFHITRIAWSAYELRLPGARTVKLDEYLNATKLLKGV